MCTIVVAVLKLALLRVPSISRRVRDKEMPKDHLHARSIPRI
jgi:hypothetical protein